jgi:hypothetical protein
LNISYDGNLLQDIFFRFIFCLVFWGILFVILPIEKNWNDRILIILVMSIGSTVLGFIFNW